MAVQNKAKLKTYFNTGDIPSENNYVDVIDSALILNDTNLGNITASGDLQVTGQISSSGGALYGTRLVVTHSAANSSSFGALSIGNINIGPAVLNDRGNDYIGFAHIEHPTYDDNPTRLLLQNATFTYQKSNDKIYFATTGSQGEMVFRVNNAGPFVGGDASPSHYWEMMKISGRKIDVYHAITSSANISSSGIIMGGTGSFDHISNVNVSTHITASGNISSSGTIIANSFTSTGGNVGGINFTDGVLITGHITASGNISSSDGGNINTDNFIGSRPILTKTSNTTLALSDRGTYNRCGPHLMTIPLDSAVDFSIGTEIDFIQTSSAGHLAFTSSSNSVTLNSRFSLLSSSGLFSAVSIKKVGNDEWDIIGDLTK